jgi:hypothetical protein
MVRHVYSEENSKYLPNAECFSAPDWIPKQPKWVAMAIQHANKPPSARTKKVGCYGFPYKNPPLS